MHFPREFQKIFWIPRGKLYLIYIAYIYLFFIRHQLQLQFPNYRRYLVAL